MKLIVTPDTHWLNPDKDKPPTQTKMFLLSKYGVASIGFFEPDFHVGWYPLLKIPQDIKQKIGTENA